MTSFYERQSKLFTDRKQNLFEKIKVVRLSYFEIWLMTEKLSFVTGLYSEYGLTSTSQYNGGNILKKKRSKQWTPTFEWYFLSNEDLPLLFWSANMTLVFFSNKLMIKWKVNYLLYCSVSCSVRVGFHSNTPVKSQIFNC